ncbi:unnamed protein product, partial [Laminaria digitata]
LHVGPDPTRPQPQKPNALGGSRSTGAVARLLRVFFGGFIPKTSGRPKGQPCPIGRWCCTSLFCKVVLQLGPLEIGASAGDGWLARARIISYEVRSGPVNSFRTWDGKYLDK